MHAYKPIIKLKFILHNTPFSENFYPGGNQLSRSDTPS